MTKEIGNVADVLRSWIVPFLLGIVVALLSSMGNSILSEIKSLNVLLTQVRLEQVGYLSKTRFNEFLRNDFDSLKDRVLIMEKK